MVIIIIISMITISTIIITYILKNKNTFFFFVNKTLPTYIYKRIYNNRIPHTYEKPLYVS